MAKYTKSFFDGTGEGGEIRINKYLSDAGVCSRREADALVAGGKVLIDGEIAVMGSKVRPGQKVCLDGQELKPEEHMVLIAFHKPQGIVCTTDQGEPDNIIDFINYGSRIFPIGRLDKDSEGLILLTNDGEIVNKILRASNGHEKEYIVQVNKPLTPEFLKGMAGGVPILDTVTKPCLVEQLDKLTFRIVLTQGLNRQIRRMCEYFDYRVRALQRVRIMNISLGRLKKGTWRNLTEWEMEGLNTLLLESSNGPAPESGKVPEGKMPPEGIVILKQTGAKFTRSPKKAGDGNRETAKESPERPQRPKETAKWQRTEKPEKPQRPKGTAKWQRTESPERPQRPKETAKWQRTESKDKPQQKNTADREGKHFRQMPKTGNPPQKNKDGAVWKKKRNVSKN